MSPLRRLGIERAARPDPLRRLGFRRAARPDPLSHPLVLGLTALALVAGAAAWAAARRSGRPDRTHLDGGHGLRVERTVTVMRPSMALYHQWRDLTHLPEFMPHLVSVTPLDGGRSHWVARGPGDMEVHWQAELVADEPGRLIAWRSVSGDVENAGSVRFSAAPGDRGTEIKIQMRYAPPAGRVGAALATVLGQGGDRQVREDLRRFKQVMETGEVANSGPLTDGERR